MKQLIVGLALVLLFAGHARAHVPTDQGTTSLLFQFQGLSSLALTPYQGAIGVRHFTSDGMALVPLVRFSVADQKQETSQNEPEAGAAIDQSSTFFGLGLGLERHIGRGQVVPYVGGGLDWVYTRQSRAAEIEGSGNTENIFNHHRLGLFGNLGFQWAALDRLLLGAEYRLGVARSWRDETSTTTNPSNNRPDRKQETSVREWDFGISTVSVGLAVVFP